MLSAGEREGNLQAELLFLPPSGLGAGVTTSPLTLPTAYASAIAEIRRVFNPRRRSRATSDPAVAGSASSSSKAFASHPKAKRRHVPRGHGI